MGCGASQQVAPHTEVASPAATTSGGFAARASARKSVAAQLVDDPTKFDRLVADHEEEIAELFRKIDTDGNGSLDADELKDIIKDYGTPHGTVSFDEDALTKFFENYATNGEIQLNEFRWYLADWACSYAAGNAAEAASTWLPEVILEVTSVLQGAQEARHKAALSDIFVLIDSDADGFVTPADCLRAVEAGIVDGASWASQWLKQQPVEEKLSLRAWTKHMLAAGEGVTEADWKSTMEAYKAGWSGLAAAQPVSEG